MFLALDVGNSFIKIQAFSSNELVDYYKFTHEEIDEILNISSIETVAISSVVPKITEQLFHLFSKLNVIPFVINSEIKLNFSNQYATPATLGADRICNLSGAVEIGSTDKHKLIIDFGTATNLNYLNGKNEFIGGSIAPGLSTMMYSLLSKTSQLINVEFKDSISPIGKSTKECIQSGIIYSQKGLISEFINELGIKIDNLEIFITGGYSETMKDYLDFQFIHEKKLSLIGIKKLFELNN